MRIEVKGPEWRLTETDPTSASFGMPFGFTLSGMPGGVAEAVGAYCRGNAAAGTVGARTIATQARSMRYFSQYAAASGIESLAGLTVADTAGYARFLRTEAVTFRGSAPPSYRTQYSAFKDLRSIVRWLQSYSPNLAPAHEAFAGCEFPGVNQMRDVDYIPDSVMTQVNEAIARSGNVALVAAVRILECTGMRRSDLLSLDVGCVSEHPVNGLTLSWYDRKSGRQHRPVPLPPACARAVSGAVDGLAEVRAELPEACSDRLLVFRDLRPGHGCKPLTPYVLKRWLDRLVEDNGIAMPDGSPANLTAHAFRRTLATDIVSKGVDITVAQELLGHADPVVTRRYYARVKSPEAKAAFADVGIVGDWKRAPESCFDSEAEREWFGANARTAARLSDGYCTKPVDGGKLCKRLMGRSRCYGCRRYITTPEFIDAHKAHLAALELELEENRFLGEHYRSHLEPTVALLKAIIGRLEAIGDGN